MEQAVEGSATTGFYITIKYLSLVFIPKDKYWPFSFKKKIGFQGRKLAKKS